MIVALIDNGSLEPAAHLNLRTVAAALARRAGVAVEPVSWKHSDRIPTTALDGTSACTLAPWVSAKVEAGERDFLLVPFFISAQGAIGSALRTDLEKLSSSLGGFSFAFTEGLAARGALAGIVAARIRETISSKKLFRLPVIVVDHGGPSSTSAALRDGIVAEVRSLLGADIGPLVAASMEGSHGPLLGDTLASPTFDHGDVVIAPLFLSPGRHAGPEGDLAHIARAASARVHFTELVGTHPVAVDALAAALRDALTSISTPLSA